MIKPLRKVSLKVLVALCALVILSWHVVAVVVVTGRPMINDDYVPDAHLHLTAGEFANRTFGGKNGRVELKISPQAPTIHDRGFVRFIGVSKRTATSLEVTLEVWTSVGWSDKPTYAYIPYDKVTWVNGNTETIIMTFDSEIVSGLFTGRGYNYGRLMTFRGAEDLVYVPDTGYDSKDYTAMNPGKLIQEHATSITIVAPNGDSDWQLVKTIG